MYTINMVNKENIGVTPLQLKTLDQGIKLLDLMLDIKSDSLNEGVSTSKLDLAIESHAGELADFYLELVNRATR